MFLGVILVLAGLLLLYYGAEYLVTGSSRLALSMGVRPLVVGLTVVAFATSMPELLVSLFAAVRGASAMAAGNVIGSNIANIGLILGVAALITTDETKGLCQEGRIALGAVAPVPMRAREAEAVLRGKALNDPVIDLASERASGEASPVTDIRASEGYRREMIRALTGRALRQALDNIEG